jgi:hypothetical protein
LAEGAIHLGKVSEQERDVIGNACDNADRYWAEVAYHDKLGHAGPCWAVSSNVNECPGIVTGVIGGMV